MLKQRVLTALVLLPLVIWGVLKLPTVYFALVLGLVVAVSAWEWGALSGIAKQPGRVAYAAMVAFALWLVWRFLPDFQLRYYLLMLGVFWWLSVVTRLWREASPEHQEGFSPLQAIMGLAVLVPAWLALVMLHDMSEHGPRWVLFILALIWVADSAAYFAGKRWGKRKLAPGISPGKSWEGVYGALAGVSLFALITAVLLQFAVGDVLRFLLLCLATAAISIVGDLFESLMKRHRGIKDSSNLLPGHGGFLDRIDSLTSASPIFVFGLLTTGLPL